VGILIPWLPSPEQVARGKVIFPCLSYFLIVKVPLPHIWGIFWRAGKGMEKGAVALAREIMKDE